MKTTKSLFLIYLPLLLIIASCENKASNDVAESLVTNSIGNDEIKKQIQAQNEVFVKALANNDSVGVANCYTIDAEFMPANEPLTKGRANIVSKIGSYIRQGMTNYTILATTVYGDGDMVTVQEVFTLSDQQGNNPDVGKSIEIWKKEDGVFKLFRDCFNSDLPIPPCPPSVQK
jgi:ketosteroid isomerase-like protein